MVDYERGEGLSDEDGQDAMTMTKDDRLIFAEAIKSKTWRDAMEINMKAILKKKTQDLTNLPTGVKPTGVKWIFKTTLKENGEIDKYKASW